MAVLLMHNEGKGCDQDVCLITGGIPLCLPPVICIETTQIHFFLCYSTVFLLSFCLPSVGGARPIKRH